ncbi:MAG: glycoside hydrolase family 38 C-terminal domain-containing protein, partial [Dehalococcoidia bacterium]
PPARGVPDAASGIDNEFFHVVADPVDGTLTVTDKRSGRVLSGLNRFVDGGDRGDEYNYCVPEDERVVERPASPPKITATAAPGMQALTIELTYELPAGLAADRRARSAATCAERIVSTVTLTAGVPRVDVETAIFNAAEDHRLRAHFPSGVHADVSKADEHFGVIQRPVKLPDWDAGTDMEQPVGTYPHKAFVSVDDGARGLAIANRGLPEYEVLETPEGAVIALTLLRSVGWLSRGDIASRRGGAGPQIRTPGAQLHGKNVVAYSIIPHEGDWARAGVHVLAVQFLRRMRARWDRRGLGSIAAQGSLLDVSSPAFQVSAIKRAEDGDGVIVRLYNTLDGPAETAVDLTPLHGAVSMVDLNEEHIADVPRVAGEVPVAARPNEIVSLRFRQ